MTKRELINLIEKLPENIDVFNYTSETDDLHGVMDIRIFLEPKNKEFYRWYFGM